VRQDGKGEAPRGHGLSHKKGEDPGMARHAERARGGGELGGRRKREVGKRGLGECPAKTNGGTGLAF